MPMQLGIIHSIVRADGLEASLQPAAELQVAGVEVRYDDSDALLSPGHGDYLRKIAKQAGVTVPSLCLAFLARQPSLVGPPDMIAQSVSTIRQAIDVAKQAGAKVILIPCLSKNAIETDKEFETITESLSELVDDADAAGVTLGIESNLNLNQQERLLSYMGGSEAVRIYFDTAGALSRKLDVATGIRKLGAQAIAQVHFKDVQLTEGQPPNFHMALGKGHVDFRATIQALRAIGYDGWIILETPPTGDPIACAKANLSYARKLIDS